MTDDRAMLLTPPAPSALAVVRLAGPGVAAFLARRFSRPALAGRAVHGTLADDAGQVLDDPVVVRVDPHTADVSLHGGPFVVRSVLALAERHGFAITPAEPDGPTDLWREVLAALPAALTPAAVRMLLAQPTAWDGLLSRADDHEMRAVLADRSGWWLTRPPTVAVVGPPNVGKSTLANELFGHTRSITAEVPGTTRDWVGAVADVGGLAVMLVDTPGVRTTADAIEAAAIVAGQDRVRSADLTVLVLDRSRPLDADTSGPATSRRAVLKVANKADAPPAWADADAIPTIATTGVGVDALRSAIRRHFACEAIDPARPRWWTDRQRDVLAERARSQRPA